MTTMDDLRVELAHAQAREARRRAYAHLDRLLDAQDRLDALPWHRRPEGRTGALLVAIRDARQRIAELEAISAVERDFRLPPVLEGPPPRRPWDPPAWKLESTRQSAPSWQLPSPSAATGTRRSAAPTDRARRARPRQQQPARPRSSRPRPAAAVRGRAGMIVTSVDRLSPFWRATAEQAVADHFARIHATAYATAYERRGQR